MIRRFVLAIVACVVVPVTVQAQAVRYDLGRKLIAFEKAWDAHPTPAERQRAVVPLKKVMGAFFGGKLDDVGRLLDTARHALVSDQPATDATRWADAIALRVQPRLVDAQQPNWTVRLDRLYDPGVAVPAGAKAQLILVGGDGATIGRPTTVEFTTLPADVKWEVDPKVEGDCRVVLSISVDGKQLATTDCGITFIPGLASRLDALRQQLEKRPMPAKTTEELTLASHMQILNALAKGRVFEADYPAARFLNEAEELSQSSSRPLRFDKDHDGQFWLTLETAKGPAPIRLFVPPGMKDTDKVPLVIAMHGAGGSENMFFDAYGHGGIVRECAKRKWMLVTTRTEGFLGAAPVAAIVDELSKRYPIDDKRVFAVGHSMGAGQVVGLAASAPDRWRGLVCLGGAGGLANPAKVKDVPFFIGVGSDDFALGGARSLVKSLQKGGNEKVKMVEYPDVEHIVVVQVALPEVFRWFDELIK